MLLTKLNQGCSTPMGVNELETRRIPEVPAFQSGAQRLWALTN